jgi:hypothetical protein
MRPHAARPAERLPGEGACDPQQRDTGRHADRRRGGAYARAAERLNHMWAHSSGVDRWLYVFRPLGAEVQERCKYGILDRRLVREGRQRKTRITHRGPGAVASRPSAVTSSQSNRSARAT